MGGGGGSRSQPFLAHSGGGQETIFYLRMALSCLRGSRMLFCLTTPWCPFVSDGRPGDELLTDEQQY